MKRKVLVAMSGGVDSSVAAALLVEKNYEVIGVTLQIWPSDLPSDESHGYKVCCSLSSVEDARRVAAKLKIPHYVLNFRDIFDKAVIKDFISEYSKGRTPNPCIKCNQHVKFESLRRKAMVFGCDFLATGHYARIEKGTGHRRYLLLKGRSAQKDQSYFLYVMTQEQLRTVLFPVGSFVKDETRKIAAEKDLPVAAKPESQEICFVPDKDYANFIEQKVSKTSSSGPIKLRNGAVVGTHRGIINYTVGQRKGLGISAVQPLYVLQIVPEENSIIVGFEKELYKREILLEDMNWIKYEKPPKEIRAKVKIRYKADEAEALIKASEEGVQVLFDKPQKAPAPGQAAVFYENDIVIGGGTIKQAFD